MKAAAQRATTTGGRDATLRHIPGDAVLSVCMPPDPHPPMGWRWVALNAVAEMESGHTPSRRHPEYWGGAIPWIGVRDAGKNHGSTIWDTIEHTNELGIENSSARLLPTGTVCLSRGGTVGYVVVLGRPMATSQGFANWICGPELNPEFLKYLFLSEIQALHRFAIGTTIQTIYYPEIKALHVCIPALPEQLRIVGILDEAFEGITTAKANAKKNVRNARALFDSYLESVFTQRGAGWVEKSVGELVAEGALVKPFDGNHGEIHPRKADYTESGVPFIMACDLKAGRVDVEECTFISRKLADSLRVGFAKHGDVLISHKGTIGRSAIVSTDEDYIVLTPQVTSYRVKDANRLFNRFIRYYFMSPIFQREMIAGAEDGSTRAYIGITKQLSLRFRFPSLSEQKQIAAKLDSIDPETRRLESIYQQKLAAFDALKKSLLHEAFTGNV